MKCNACSDEKSTTRATDFLHRRELFTYSQAVETTEQDAAKEQLRRNSASTESPQVFAGEAPRPALRTRCAGIVAQIKGLPMSLRLVQPLGQKVEVQLYVWDVRLSALVRCAAAKGLLAHIMITDADEVEWICLFKVLPSNISTSRT